MPERAELIGVDWGTSSLRAYLLSRDGRILDRRASHEGILSAAPLGFPSVLARMIGGWLDPGRALPVLMSGMIGSRQGWKEAAYLACPADLVGLAGQLTALDAVELQDAGISVLRIVPGLSCRNATGVPDVIRGEETQIAGVLETLKLCAGHFVLPGTHSKWVRVDDGRITSFATYMTGEVYAALKGHTILGRLMKGGAASPLAFERGVRAASDHTGAPGALLHHIFSARTLALFDELAETDGAAYLSGLLIGAELVAAAPAGEEFVISGGAELVAHYARAAEHLGVTARLAPADCVAAGHIAIARAAGLI